LVDSSSSRAAAERLAKMREPDVEIARESACGRGWCAVAVDQDAAGTKRSKAATVERELRACRADVMQRIARHHRIAGRQRLVEKAPGGHRHSAREATEARARGRHHGCIG